MSEFPSTEDERLDRRPSALDFSAILTANGMLHNMPKQALKALRPLFEFRSLNAGAVLSDKDGSASEFHFILAGFASQIGSSSHGNLGLGLLGREGMAGSLSLILGSPRTGHTTVMEMSGASVQIPAREFMLVLNTCEPLRAFLLKYLNVQQLEASYTAMSAGRFNINERMGRLLLMCHDRVDGDTLPLNHGFFATMLGVRRASVTNALHFLEGSKCVVSKPGLIKILDRQRLRDIATDSYGCPELEYDRSIGPWINRDEVPSCLSSSGAAVII